jgi:small subunit ribosomal protein S13
VSKELRYIVRLHGTGLDGTKKVPYALNGIKGVGINLAQSITKIAGINPEARLGDLTDVDLRKIEEVLRNPLAQGIPFHMLNRRRDLRTGKDIHVLGPDLDLNLKDDIDLMKEIRSWKGIRHAQGLRVRGQKTRTTGRKGKAIGVSKKQRIAAPPAP